MTTGERIKSRRKQLGYSAEYVAEKLGVSPATIYRYEKGDIEKMPGSILEPLSRILHTTPAFLMGWDDSDVVKLDSLLKTYRSTNGLTIQQFADRCGLSSNLISMLENGYHLPDGRILVPSMAQFIKLCDGMHITLDYLFSILDAQDWVNNGFCNDSDLLAELSEAEWELIYNYRSLTSTGKEYIKQTMSMAMLSYSSEKGSLSDLEDPT